MNFHTSYRPSLGTFPHEAVKHELPEGMTTQSELGAAMLAEAKAARKSRRPQPVRKRTTIFQALHDFLAEEKTWFTIQELDQKFETITRNQISNNLAKGEKEGTIQINRSRKRGNFRYRAVPK